MLDAGGGGKTSGSALALDFTFAAKKPENLSNGVEESSFNECEISFPKEKTLDRHAFGDANRSLMAAESLDLGSRRLSYSCCRKSSI